MQAVNILALSGSLRRLSYNTAVLKALQQLAPDFIDMHVYKGLGDLPLFNPDLEKQTIPAFDQLRHAVANCDALIIASPEYAHGISGVLKNALDWLVSGEEFVDIPICLINTSPRAHHAQDALKEVITTMSGRIITTACLSIPLLGSQLNANTIVNKPEMAKCLQESLQRFYDAICQQKDTVTP